MAAVVLPSLIPLKQAAKRVGYPYTSLRAAHHRGELKVYIIKSHWYVDEQDLAAFFASSKV